MISNTTISAKYTVTAGVLQFSIPFRIYKTTDVSVFWSSDGKADTTLALGTDYSVAIGSEGGTVTLVSGKVPVGSILAIEPNFTATQETDLSSTTAISTAALEIQLDKQTQLILQQERRTSRAVILPATSSESPEDVVASVYASRDAAAASASDASAQATAAQASATAAASSAATAAQTVQTASAEAVAKATEQAQAAAIGATAAAQSAADAAAASGGLAPRMDAAEQINAQQDTRLDAVESGVTAIATTLIGSVQSVMATDTYVPNGCVPANGSEYDRSQFPSLYDTYLAEGKLLTCTYAAWTAQVAQTGNCAKFALDADAQKFKVPLLKDGDSITQAASAAELGKSVMAGLPNITGSISPTASTNSANYIFQVFPQASGALRPAEASRATAFGANGVYESNKPAGIAINASWSSSIYGNSTTVTDEQVRLRHFVVVASAQNSASVFDWSNYMAALAGKANLDLSNATGNAMKYYFMARDEKASGTGGGATSADSVMTRDINTVKVNTIGATLTSNRITLPAGRYRIKAIMPAIGTNSTRAVLYDYTHSAYLEYGQNVYSSSALAANCLASVEADVTFATDTQVEVRMYTGAANANGCGVATSIPGVVEVYTKVEIWKL